MGDVFGLLNLTLAVVSFCAKSLQIISSKFGCKDTSAVKRMSRLSRVSKVEIRSPSSGSQIPMMPGPMNVVRTNEKPYGYDEGANKVGQVEMINVVSSPICLS